MRSAKRKILRPLPQRRGKWLLKVADRHDDHRQRGGDGEKRSRKRTLAGMKDAPFGKALFIETPAVLQHRLPLVLSGTMLGASCYYRFKDAAKLPKIFRERVSLQR